MLYSLGYPLPMVIDLAEPFSVYGLENWHSYIAPLPQFWHGAYWGTCLVWDLNDGPFQIIGAGTFTDHPEGYTSLPYFILPPIIQWSNHPLVPPPQQFSTRDGSLVGAVDGVNSTFSTSTLFGRAQVAVNGVMQTLNVDCCAPSGSCFIKFLPGHYPQPGDVVTCEIWANL